MRHDAIARLFAALGQMMGNAAIEAVGSPKQGESWLLEEVVQRVTPAAGRFHLTFNDFNQLVAGCGYKRATQHFFEYYFHDVNNIDQFEEAVKRFQIDALLAYGNFSVAYTLLATSSEDAFWAEITRIRPRVSVQQFEDRRSEFSIEALPDKEAALLSYFVSRRIYSLRDSIAKLTASYNTSSRTEASEQEQLADILDSETLEMLQLEEGCLGDEPKDLLNRVAGAVMKVVDKRTQCVNIGKRNVQRYLSLRNADVYTAGVLRTAEDIKEFRSCVEFVFRKPELESLHLRYFDPTVCFSEDAIALNLLHALILRKCTAALYIINRENAAINSDIGAALASGKHVIVYVPSGPHSGDLSKLAARFAIDGPLGLQLIARTGAPRGVLVVRTLDECAILIRKVVTGSLEFEIRKSGNYFNLVERITQSIISVTPADPTVAALYCPAARITGI